MKQALTAFIERVEGVTETLGSSQSLSVKKSLLPDSKHKRTTFNREYSSLVFRTGLGQEIQLAYWTTSGKEVRVHEFAQYISPKAIAELTTRLKKAKVKWKFV